MAVLGRSGPFRPHTAKPIVAPAAPPPAPFPPAIVIGQARPRALIGRGAPWAHIPVPLQPLPPVAGRAFIVSQAVVRPLTARPTPRPHLAAPIVAPAAVAFVAPQATVVTDQAVRRLQTRLPAPRAHLVPANLAPPRAPPARLVLQAVRRALTARSVPRPHLAAANLTAAAVPPVVTRPKVVGHNSRMRALAGRFPPKPHLAAPVILEAFPVGVFVYPSLVAAWNPAANPALDPAFAPIVAEIEGVAQAFEPLTSGSESFGAAPLILHAFHNWGARFSSNATIPLLGDGSINTVPARMVLFDDSGVYYNTGPNGTGQVVYYDYQTSGTVTYNNRADTTSPAAATANVNVGPKRFADFVAARYPGSTCMITWRTAAVDWTNNMENASSWQEEFSLANIAAGNWDTFIKANAAQIATWIYNNPGTPLQFRIDQEENANNYPHGYSNQFHNPAAPDTGPIVCNALNQAATSGNPVNTSFYGLYAQMFRRVSTLLLDQAYTTLTVTLGMTPSAARDLLGTNLQTTWCVGSGTVFPKVTIAGTPLDGSQTSIGLPFPGITATLGGATYGPVATVVTSSGSSVVTFTGSTTNGPVGHPYPIGSVITFASTGTGLDGNHYTVTAIPAYNQLTVTTALSNGTLSPAAGTAALYNVSAYVQQVGQWMSFYPGDDSTPVANLPIVGILSIDGYNRFGTSWRQVNGIYDNATNTGAYSSLAAAIVGKGFQISESASVENACAAVNPLVSDTTGLPDGAIASGNQVTSNFITDVGVSCVGLQLTGPGVPANTYVTSVTGGVATVNNTCTNGTALALSLVAAVITDGSMTVTGGPANPVVTITSAALYTFAYSSAAGGEDYWMVAGGVLPTGTYIGSIAAGVATLVFPFGGGPTTNGTTTGLTFTVTPPQKADWLTLGWDSSSSQSFWQQFPRMSEGVVYFDHDSSKTGFTGTYDVRDTTPAFTAWQGLVTDPRWQWGELLPVYPAAGGPLQLPFVYDESALHRTKVGRTVPKPHTARPVVAPATAPALPAATVVTDQARYRALTGRGAPWAHIPVPLLPLPAVAGRAFVVSQALARALVGRTPPRPHVATLVAPPATGYDEGGGYDRGDYDDYGPAGAFVTSQAAARPLAARGVPKPHVAAPVVTAAATQPPVASATIVAGQARARAVIGRAVPKAHVAARVAASTVAAAPLPAAVIVTRQALARAIQGRGAPWPHIPVPVGPAPSGPLPGALVVSQALARPIAARPTPRPHVAAATLTAAATVTPVARGTFIQTARRPVPRLTPKAHVAPAVAGPVTAAPLPPAIVAGQARARALVGRSAPRAHLPAIVAPAAALPAATNVSQALLRPLTARTAPKPHVAAPIVAQPPVGPATVVQVVRSPAFARPALRPHLAAPVVAYPATAVTVQGCRTAARQPTPRLTPRPHLAPVNLTPSPNVETVFVTVKAQPRTFTVAGQARTVTVEAQPRTFTVEARSP